MSETFPKKNGKNSDASFSSICFGFIAFSGVSQRWESKALQKTFVQRTSRLKKFLQQKSTKIPNYFFVEFLLSRSWRFSV
jgi:hypothetical protein